MVLRTATKDENVPRPRTLIMVAARDRDRATLGSRTRPCRPFVPHYRHFGVEQRLSAFSILHRPLRSAARPGAQRRFSAPAVTVS